jgi:DNA-binding NtrC family response regulator
MPVKIAKILLIATSPTGVSFLVARLKKWECEVHFASSYKEAHMFIGSKIYDLVLSEFRLSDGSSYPLTDLLIGSNTTLVYSYPVEAGCYWLPAVKNGQSCWGARAMRPGEFVAYLEEILKEIKSRRAATSEESRAANSS